MTWHSSNEYIQTTTPLLDPVPKEGGIDGSQKVMNQAFALNPSMLNTGHRTDKYGYHSLRNPVNCMAWIFSIGLHSLILFLLAYQASNPRPVLVKDNQNQPGHVLSTVKPEAAVQPEIIKAVSVDSREVNAVVNALRQNREKAQRAENLRQQRLAQQAEAAKQQRLNEEKRLQQLKEEAEKIAITRKKQWQEEQIRLKQLAEKKAEEVKRIEAMKKEQEALQKKQQEETKKLADLKQKQLAEKLLAEKVKMEKEKAEALKVQKQRAEQAAVDAARRQEAAARRAQIEAANQARIAGEVDKYKAMIINAISRQWILPDTVNRSLSSQFRIRLAPDGGVLEVSLIRSSGDPILDRSAQSAIYKASPLPVPTDPVTFNLFRDITLTVRPENAGLG